MRGGRVRATPRSLCEEGAFLQVEGKTAGREGAASGEGWSTGAVCLLLTKMLQQERPGLPPLEVSCKVKPQHR